MTMHLIRLPPAAGASKRQAEREENAVVIIRRLACSAMLVLGLMALSGCGSSTSEPESKPVSINTQGWPTPPEEVDLGSLQDQAITGVDGCQFNSFSTARQIAITCEDARKALVTIEKQARKPFCDSEQEEAVIHCFASGGVAVETWAGTAERASDFLIALTEQLNGTSEENAVEAEEAAQDEEPAVSGVATDNKGDRVLVNIFTGVPGSAKSLSNSTIGACEEDIADLGSSPERSAAIPVSVEMKVLSSVGVDVAVDLEDVGLVEREGEVPQGAVAALWAGEYSEGPACNLAVEGGTVHWDPEDARPGVVQTHQSWLILPETITPNSTAPTTTNRLVFESFVKLAGLTADLEYKATSRSLAYCYTGFDSGISPAIALNEQVVVARGCGEVK